jgi:hypothetical protein
VASELEAALGCLVAGLARAQQRGRGGQEEGRRQERKAGGAQQRGQGGREGGRQKQEQVAGGVGSLEFLEI